MNKYRWSVFQNGAREKYAIAEALKKNNALSYLITDLWFNSSHFWVKKVSKLFPSFRSRHNKNIADSQVINFNRFFLLKKMFRMDIHDEEFSKLFSETLQKIADNTDIVFCYNYVAKDLLEEAKSRNKLTVLGQVDAGPYAGRLVTEIHKREFGTKMGRDDQYEHIYAEWKMECELADKILVNSDWSRECLVKEGIKANKIVKIPLAYVPPFDSLNFKRKFKPVISKKMPLEVLFLGSVSVQKGVFPLVRAAKKLLKAPVHFTIVGDLHFPTEYWNDLPPNVTYYKRVSPCDVNNFYKVADVFLLPTYSDGFALTQLEAQSWKLPIITTPFCGRVVNHEENGKLMSKVDEEEIVSAIEDVISNPHKLVKYSKNSINLSYYSLDVLGKQLSNLF